MQEPEFRQRGPVPERLSAALGGSFSEHELGVLNELSRLVEYGDGETIVTEGRDGDAAAVVVEGSVNVLRDGGVVAAIGVGEIIGEMSLLSGAPRSATLVAASPLCVLTLSRPGFTKLIEECPRLEQLVKSVAQERAAGAD